jgi:acyl-CoA oxidase
MSDALAAVPEAPTDTNPKPGARPDPGELGRFLDGEFHEIRERARGALSLPEMEPVWGLPIDEYRELVMKRMKLLASTGSTAIGFPESVGGENNVAGSVVSFETLGHGDLSLLVKCGVQFGLFGGAVLHLGNEKHHEEYLPGVISAELPGAFAMTETSHGSNVQAIGTTATFDNDACEFVINTPDEGSRKDYIGNAAVHGRMAAVFAQLHVNGENHGVHALLVPLRDSDGNVCDGVRIEDCGPKLGLDGVDNGRIWFDHVRVPRTALLDRYAQVDEDGNYQSPIENANRRFFTTIGTLIQGRVSVSGAAQSATKSALTIAVRHAMQRRQFGPPDGDEEELLINFRVHQRRLLPLLAKTYALHFAQRELVAGLHTAFTTEGGNPDRDQRQLESYAAGVKAVATWHATETIQTCREACGGAGYLAENRFAALKADTDVFTTFEGDNTILLQLVAKGLLTDYKEKFGDLSQLELVRFVGGQVFEQAVERTLARQLVTRIADAVTPNNDDEPEIESPEYQVELFRFREEHSLDGVARRLKRGIDDGGDQFDVFNDAQDHVLETARAWIDRQILEKFQAGVDEADGELKELLSKVCSLYALTTIEANGRWYFEHGRMTGPRSKAITRATNRLCAELAKEADKLVNAFGIPDAILAAPIATGGAGDDGGSEPAAD